MNQTKLNKFIKDLVDPAQKFAKENASQASLYIGLAVAIAVDQAAVADNVRSQTNNIYLKLAEGDTTSVKIAGIEYKKYASYEEAIYDLGTISIESKKEDEHPVVLDTGITLSRLFDVVTKYDLSQYDLIDGDETGEENIGIESEVGVETELVVDDTVSIINEEFVAIVEPIEDTTKDEITEEVPHKVDEVQITIPDSKVNIVEIEDELFTRPIYRVAREVTTQNHSATAYFDLDIAIAECNKLVDYKVFGADGIVLHVSKKKPENNGIIKDIMIFTGTKVRLNYGYIYQAATSKHSFTTLKDDVDVFIYNNTLVNDRYPVCLSKEVAGKGFQHIFGYIDKDDIL